MAYSSIRIATSVELARVEIAELFIWTWSLNHLTWPPTAVLAEFVCWMSLSMTKSMFRKGV